MSLLLGLAVLVLLFFGAVFWVGLAVIGKSERDQKKAESNSAEILDAAFDGRPNVTFNVNWGSLKYETVIMGATERGYRLAHQAGDLKTAMTLVFEKV